MKLRLSDMVQPLLGLVLLIAIVLAVLAIMAPFMAAIILSLESVFAAIGGVWLLDETLSVRAWCGCGLMMAGMLLSQVRWPGSGVSVPQPT